MFPEHVSLVFLTTSHLLVAEKMENLDILVSKNQHFHFSYCLLDQSQKKPDLNAIMSSPVLKISFTLSNFYIVITLSLFALFRDYD